jgi:predicted DNA-binding transcriptional regulator AlpA
METETHSLPELLTVPDLAAYLGIPVRNVYFWRATNQGPPALKVGKRLYFRATDVSAWLDKQAASSTVTTAAAAPRKGGERISRDA